MASTIGIKLDDETRARLQSLSGIKDRSSHWMMKKAITEYIEREEAFEREKQEDMARWQTYQETGEAFTQTQMSDWFDELEEKANRAETS